MILLNRNKNATRIFGEAHALLDNPKRWVRGTLG
jgi:hypothetical protein